LFFTAPSGASQFAIQLEASKSPSLQSYQALNKHNNLYKMPIDNGYIRIRMGPYESRKLAQSALEKIHEAGHRDAFITTYSNADTKQSLDTSMAVKKQHEIETFDVKTMKEWKMLTAEQQANLVYLDGKLHIKNGRQFTPLSDIISK